jgi:hypothetical protein
LPAWAWAGELPECFALTLDDGLWPPETLGRLYGGVDLDAQPVERGQQSSVLLPRPLIVRGIDGKQGCQPVSLALHFVELCSD